MTMTDSMDRGAGQSAGKSAEKSDEQWRAELTPEQYRVLRQQGTERAFTGAYCDNKEAGVYRCAGCGAQLFSSDTKFDSGTGWPSFYDVAESDAVETETDTSHGMRRTEVHCAACGGHLGHLFPDGPRPTGQRYCINSISLAFEPTDSDPTDSDPEDRDPEDRDTGAGSSD